MKKLKNLGEALSKNEQRAINGGAFCIIHCYAECLESNGYDSDQFCGQLCQNLAAQNGGGGF